MSGLFHCPDAGRKEARSRRIVVEPFIGDQWWLLPLPLRIRWWQETEYSMRVPSPELVEAVKAALAATEPLRASLEGGDRRPRQE